MPAESSISLAIVGGGLAGLAAAVAAAERGVRAEIFEQAAALGGRAGSFVDSTTGDRIDHCQHVAMGCCTGFLDFCRRAEIDDCFDRCRTLHFFSPDGARRDFTPSWLLPAPLHLLPAFARLSFLSWPERLAIVRAVARLAKSPDDLQETITAWLRRNGQTDRTLELFWSPVLISALGETLDHAAVPFARKVFCEGFLASRTASELVLPNRPLGAVFHDRFGRWLAENGVAVHLAAPVRRVEGDQFRAQAVVLADGTRRRFDRVIVAVPWRGIRSLLDKNLSAAIPSLPAVERIESAAITAVHLWFDRAVMPLRHAVLLGRLSQWAFAKGNYVQVVISASHRLPERSHEDLVNEVLADLQSIWGATGSASAGLNRGQGAASSANTSTVAALAEPVAPDTWDVHLVHSRVVTQPAALFSAVPGVDDFRPPQRTPVENLALAGDWTSTGWPATMESAVRSGFAAVDAVGFGGEGRGTGDGGRGIVDAISRPPY
jgi:squalene-associated FAD-dependent desaturase